MKKRIVVALGGNAILTTDPSAKGQQKALAQTAYYLADFVEAGHELIITHGNGPQVGNLLLQQQKGSTEKNPAMPVDTAVAMTQGSIGYWLENALVDELKKRNISKNAATILTQVVVSETDPAFQTPSKPIGPFLSEAEMKAEKKKTRATFVEDSGRGFRKVVPSPKPIGIVEYPVIKQLVENGIITIAGGGGGIPVIVKDGTYQGVEAVIDKDFASEKIAALVHADMLVILTGVDHVSINFNQPNQSDLTKVSVADMEKYVEENQFAPGSMLPKVQAAITFIKENAKGKAVITSLENVKNLLTEETGTIITA
ncbi:carbamate kinase [Enterococcus moraviensis ATCC BAA-383]|uniref:Carbamate kinase n=1 Tax=Enterococcus moraviensis ATCC BAA-383 TaxID=1158609 RepID=R2SZV7_9ENTE|nr:carbamate kinase [Enterococcus moraviensis]EOI00728.1 carbamate kinase [Enterococcus moraviensis ATCC BAA-383]EOT73043.1 carbamate kinase [Enterococcus moraviensis ATCC BAA-383]OJG68605.1 carbamate kinase [Enterococcus moraviensis]